MPKFNPFDVDLENGRKWELPLLEKISRLRLREKVRYLGRNQEFQRKGIDGIVYAEKAKIDPKSRKYSAYKYKDILIETISVIEKNKLGWFYTSEADVIAYVWENASRTNLIDGYFIFIQDTIFRKWFENYKLANPQKRRIAWSQRNGHFWSTENFAVPITKFPKGAVLRFNPKLPSTKKQSTLNSFEE